MSVSCECRALSGRDRADHSSREVLPSVFCLSAIAKPLRGGHSPKSGRSATEKNLIFEKTEGVGSKLQPICPVGS